MILGAHVVIFTRDADKDRAFFRDVMGFDNVDAGGGWLIFKLPPSEAAFHPANESAGSHKLYLMVEDVAAEIARLTGLGYACEAIVDAGWGKLSGVALPGGGKLEFYQPRHQLAHG
ncbi:MAG: hypothetical protein NW203_09300 [Hyphomonadaceae bacterium]|nr:hypothetical protein [Hyphomonadaceae bacterium]